MGTRASDFFQIDEKSGEIRMINMGHGEGEMWGLSCHPSGVQFASGSFDGTVRIWDIAKKVRYSSDV